MKFRYKKHVSVMDEVDLELPYYYEIIRPEYEIYGKLTENEIQELNFMIYEDSISWDVERKQGIIDNISYIIKQEKSTEEKFEAAKQKVVDFLA